MMDGLGGNITRYAGEREEYPQLLKKYLECSPHEASPAKEIKRLIHQVLESFHGPALVVDIGGIVEYSNSYMSWLMGQGSDSLLGKEFVTLCLPVESRDEIRNIFKKIRLESFVGSNVLCKLRTYNNVEHLINWKITPLQSDVHGLNVMVLLGYNIEDYRPMHNFDPIVSPFPSTGVFIIQDGKIKFWNSHISYYSGLGEAEMIDYHYHRIVHPEDKDSVRKKAMSMLRGESEEPYEYRYINRNGETRWAVEAVVPVVYGGRRATLGYAMDITEQKNMQRTLQESENIYRTIFENSGTAMVIFEDDGMITMANRETELLSGFDRSEIENMNMRRWTEFVDKNDLNRIMGYHELRLKDENGLPRNYEFNLMQKNGTIKNIYMTISVIPGTRKRLASMIDITPRRQAEDKLRFLSVHDKLTGLYNRAFFEEQLEALQSNSTDRFSMIACDIDGLKLINDTFGHLAGDSVLLEMGRILAKCARKHDMVARTGGDEFAVLLVGGGYAEAETVCSSVRRLVAQYNDQYFEYPLSVSLGFAVAEDHKNNPYDLFKLADNNMYREKLLHSQSIRNSIVQIAMKALGERDFVTEGHAERLRNIVDKMLMECAPNGCNSSDMVLLAEFHDIGKVGIPDHILFKRGPLTKEEYAEMQRHCEIGQRIALSSPELAPIADWILKHHERWDGNGYPLKLKGDQIPLACRILALADSYDAMISDRPYRKAMSHQDALAEIVRCSGSQFDPDLVRVFVRIFEHGVTAPQPFCP